MEDWIKEEYTVGKWMRITDSFMRDHHGDNIIRINKIDWNGDDTIFYVTGFYDWEEEKFLFDSPEDYDMDLDNIQTYEPFTEQEFIEQVFIDPIKGEF